MSIVEDLNEPGNVEPSYVNLTEEHAQELDASSITPEIAEKHGVHSAYTRAELPEWSQWIADKFGDDVFPVLVYPMREPDGSETGQVKPQKGTVTDRDDKIVKYLSPAGSNASPQLPLIRRVDDPKGVLLVEGTKQARAADAWAPAEYAIYQLAGITGWMRDGGPTRFIPVVEDLSVIIAPDADAATNPKVFDAAMKLRAACEEWSDDVKFLRISGSGTTGLDDRLGATSPDQRSNLFRRWTVKAKARPAEHRPSEKEYAKKALDQQPAGERPMVRVDEDRHEVIKQLETILREAFDGTELFRHGEGLGHLTHEEDGPVIEDLSEGAFNRVLARATQTVKVLEKGVRHEWPDANTMKALVAGYRDYTRIDGVSSVPVIRRDGSIVTETGYDPETRLYVHLSEDLQSLDVPESPTDTDIDQAVSLLLDDLLVDFPLKGQADVAHALAAFITPLIRKLVDLVPLCVIDGLQSRVGKGLFMECLVRVMTGSPPDLMSLPRDDERELRLLLTSVLLSGQTFIVFDEAHKIYSEILCQALTQQTWADRLLGGNQRARLRNVASWYAAGNKVERSGDIAGRAYSVRLHTDAPDPGKRSGFKHDLGTWVPKHRSDLLRAVLVLVRAWFARGRPEPTGVPVVLGGFERWRAVVGGILEVAGIDGFLDSVEDEQLASDFVGQQQRAFVDGVADKFGLGVGFTTKQVSMYLVQEEDAPAPHGLNRLKEKVDSQALGLELKKLADTWPPGGDTRIIRLDRMGHNKVSRWMVEKYWSAVAGPPDPDDSAAASTGPVAPAASAAPTVDTCDECGSELLQHPRLALVASCPTCHPDDFEEVA